MDSQLKGLREVVETVADGARWKGVSGSSGAWPWGLHLVPHPFLSANWLPCVLPHIRTRNNGVYQRGTSESESESVFSPVSFFFPSGILL